MRHFVILLSQYLPIHWSSWPGLHPMLNPSRFSILPDETEPILLPGRASLGPPKLLSFSRARFSSTLCIKPETNYFPFMQENSWQPQKTL